LRTSGSIKHLSSKFLPSLLDKLRHIALGFKDLAYALDVLEVELESLHFVHKISDSVLPKIAVDKLHTIVKGIVNLKGLTSR